MPLLLLLLEAVTYFANAESAGKFPLYSDLSTRAPARISDAKLVMGCRQSRAPVTGYAPLMTISIDSSPEGLSLTWKARVCQWPTYSPNGSWGFCRVATRFMHLGIKSRLKEFYSRNTWERSSQVMMVAMSRDVNHLSAGPVRLFWNKHINSLSSA